MTAVTAPEGCPVWTYLPHLKRPARRGRGRGPASMPKRYVREVGEYNISLGRPAEDWSCDCGACPSAVSKEVRHAE